MIEDFFEKSVRKVIIRGKTFNPKIPFNKNNEYGKYIFAEQVVKKKQHTINFSGFKPILDRIDIVLKEYQEYLSKSTKNTGKT